MVPNAGAGQYLESAVWFDRALVLDPRSARLHFNRGIVLGAAGRVDQAIASLREAEAISPADIDVHLHLARLLSTAGKDAEASTHRAKAERLRAHRIANPGR